MVSQLKDFEPQEKRVIIRVDFNVPFDKPGGEITDDTRIVKSLPTLQHLLQQNASLIILSHMGRPKGKKNKAYSLKKVADRLSTLLPNHNVIFNEDELGESTIKATKQLNGGDILILENIRFYKEETSDNESDRASLANILAQHGDAYVNDAFGACHRRHASIYELATCLPAYAGFLVQKEIEILDNILVKPVRPFVAVIGGAKVSSKLKVLEKLITKVDTTLIGGGMAYTFLKARALQVGNSMVENDFLSKAFQIVDKAAYNNSEILLPIDHIVTTEFSETAKRKTVGKEIPTGFMGMDIGPKTTDKYIKILKSAKTILWNGPMGVFEMEQFSTGTMKIAKTISKLKATTVVGGGDSVFALKKAGVEEKVTHVSTGGGATLEYIEGKKLPGIEVLQDTEK